MTFEELKSLFYESAAKAHNIPIEEVEEGVSNGIDEMWENPNESAERRDMINNIFGGKKPTVEEYLKFYIQVKILGQPYRKDFTGTDLDGKNNIIIVKRNKGGKIEAAQQIITREAFATNKEYIEFLQKEIRARVYSGNIKTVNDLSAPDLPAEVKTALQDMAKSGQRVCHFSEGILYIYEKL